MAVKTKTFGTRIKHFLRGMGSVIDVQPGTRQSRSPGSMTFTRTVFINGRKIQLDAKRDPFEETVKAYASDWQRITGDIEKTIGNLPASTRAHANRRLAATR